MSTSRPKPSSSRQQYCELCGRQAEERKAVIIDNAVFKVCNSCSRHGKPYTPAIVAAGQSRKNPGRSIGSGRALNRPPTFKKQTKKIEMTDQTMLAPDFARQIREARMKLGVTHEQLGMRMNEKATILRKFETGALKPDELFAKKLERYLGIKLYVSTAEEEQDS